MAGESVVGPQVAAPRREKKARLVHAGFTIPFILLILCFAAWGSAANLTDVLVGVFRHISRCRTSSRRSCSSPTTGRTSRWPSHEHV
jgi:hypothetical protein